MLGLINEPVRPSDEAEFESLLDSLLVVLRQDVEVYGELQANINEKRDVLRRPSLELLTASNSKTETCVLKAKILEEARASIVKKIAKSLGRQEKDITLTVLASCVDGQRKTELKAQQMALSSLMGSINEINEKNKVLLDYSVSYVKSTMDFINNLFSTGADYINTGQLKAGARNGRILCKEG
ncbi:MAG: flagellar protein FlgN [Syntrophales bacterium]